MSFKSFQKKNLPKSIKDLNKEQLQEILKKKKECNAIALKIVETLSEQEVNKEWMINNLVNINQSHFDDVITERSISKYCGYPLCTASLGEVPQQQYRISLSSKSVYDITERKKFCSGHCYKASQFLKTQLLTSPLWFRDGEVIPAFKLMSLPVATEKLEQPVSSQDLPVLPLPPSSEEINCDNCSKTSAVSSNLPESYDIQLETRNSDAKTKKDIQKVDEVDPVSKVEKAIEQWFTVNTYAYLLGEDKLKNEFQGKENIIKSVMKTQSSLTSDSNKFDQISRLFSILNLDGGDSRDVPELKPLPDYSMLKAEAEDLNIKVKAFYTGQLEMAAEKVGNLSSGETERNIAGELPLVDCHAQMALRRRVLLDRLNREVPDMCVSLEAAGLVSVGDIRSLVQTFSLSAHNITFKPREWFLVAAALLKMLSLKMAPLARSLAHEESRKRATLLLMSYNLSPDYMDNLMEWLTDTERLTLILQS